MKKNDEGKSIDNLPEVEERKLFVENLVIVDGIGRSGKVMLCNIVASLNRVEIWQYDPLFEMMSFLTGLRLMREDVAVGLLRCGVDNHAYDIMLGRNANFRYYDGSSVFRQDPGKYLKRCFDKRETDSITKIVREEKIIFSFMTHEMLCYPKIFLKAWPFLKIIHISRNPIDVINSWYERGWGKRMAVDPTAFTFVFKGKKGHSVPWYALDWKIPYADSSEVDRCIKSVNVIYKKMRESYNKLPKEHRKRLLVIPFEKLVVDPDREIRNICRFLDTTPTTITPRILSEERCPRAKEIVIKEREEAIEKIRKIASKKMFSLMMELSEEYSKEDFIKEVE